MLCHLLFEDPLENGLDALKHPIMDDLVCLPFELLEDHDSKVRINLLYPLRY